METNNSGTILQASYSTPRLAPPPSRGTTTRAQGAEDGPTLISPGSPGAGVVESGFTPAMGHSPLFSDICGTWIIGGGFYVLQPSFDNNPAFVISNTVVSGGNVTTTSQQQDFDWDHEFAPRLWVGYVEDGFGVRSRFWRFDQGVSTSVANLGGSTISASPLLPAVGVPFVSTTPGGSLNFGSDLDLTVIDLEAIQEFKGGSWSFLATSGVRYADLSQSFHATVRSPNALVGQPRQGTIQFSNRFDGIGPTISFEARRPLFGGLGFYGSLRGSLLFGNSRQQSTQFAQLPGGTNAFGQVSSERDDVLPIGELELGLEYARECGHCLVFVQVGGVGQIWHGAGSASSGTGDLGFTGLTLMVGLHF